MKKFLLVLFLILVGGCVEVGKFTPERHAQHEIGHPDCQETSERCIENVPW